MFATVHTYVHTCATTCIKVSGDQGIRGSGDHYLDWDKAIGYPTGTQ